MTVLSDLLEKVKNNPLDDQMKHICDQIQVEEEEKFKVLAKEKPKGSNIFLAILIPEITKNEIDFLCLERDFPGSYIISLWSKQRLKDGTDLGTIKRVKVWECKEIYVQKILESYSKILKFMKGDV